MKLTKKKYFLILFLFSCFSYTQKQTKGDSLSDLADVHYQKKEFGKAIDKERLALLWYQQLQKASKISNKLNNIGLYHYMLAQYDSSLYYYNQSLEIDLDLGNHRRVISRYKNIGITHKKMGSFNISIEYYLKALNLSLKVKNYKELGSIYNSIGNILLIQEKPNEAIQYLKNASRELIVQKDTLGYSKATNNLGSVHFRLAQYDSAMYYYNRALKLKRFSSKTISIAANLNNIGEVFLAMKQIDSALVYFKKALDLKLIEKNAQSIILTSNNLARIYLETSQTPLASKYLDISEKNLKSTDSNDMMAHFFELKSQWYEKTGDNEKALEYYKKWQSLQEQLFQKEKIEVVEKLKEYEKDIVEQEKNKAEAEVLWQKQLNKRQNSITWIIVLALCGMVVLILVIGRSRQKLKSLNEQLEIEQKLVKKLNMDLNILVDEVKHRKQNDFNRLIGLIDQIKKKNGELDSELSPLSSAIIATSNIDDFLENVDAGHYVNLHNFYKVLLKKLELLHKLSKRNIVVNDKIQSKKVPANIVSILAFITCELVNNSIKHGIFNVQKPELKLSITFKGDECSFRYSDNGNKGNFEDQLVNSSRLGWSIMKRFVASLNSELSLEKESTTTVIFFSFQLKEILI